MSTLVQKSGTATALAVVGAIALTSPAHAQATTVSDPTDAAGSNYDIRAATVSHEESTVAVNVRFADLQDSYSSNASAVIYFDVDASRAGPEYAVTTGLGPGTDYALRPVRNWAIQAEPSTCSHRMTLGYGDERLRFTTGRSCLGSPTKVRVGVHMRDSTDASHPVSDWLVGSKQFSGWVARS